MEKEMIDKELIENAIAEALKTGGDFAEIFVEDKRSSSAYFDDGKVEEFFYNTVFYTKKRISKSIKENKEIYLCTMEGMYHLKPEDLPIDFNNNEPKNI